MLNEILLIVGLTLFPGLELRASIPYGVFQTDLHWSLVFAIAILTNALLGPLVYILIDKLLHLVLRIDLAQRGFGWYQRKVQRKIQRKVDRYGDLGLALFIGVPLPGSGSYSGAVAAHLMAMRFDRFFLVNLVGVAIAGILVLLVCLFGDGAWSFFLKI